MASWVAYLFVLGVGALCAVVSGFLRSYSDNKRRLTGLPMVHQFCAFHTPPMLVAFKVLPGWLFKVCGQTMTPDFYKDLPGLFARHGPVLGVANSGLSAIYLADADIIKAMTVGDLRKFVKKDVEEYESLLIYGSNIVASEGDEWKRHRRVANPAFGKANIELVAATAVEVAKEMFASLAERHEERDGNTLCNVDVRNQMMLLTLGVMGKAGFGEDMGVFDVGPAFNAERLTFPEAFHTVMTHFVGKLVIPSFAYGLPNAWIQETRLGFSEFERMLDLFIDSRFAAAEAAEAAGADSDGGEAAPLGRDLMSLLIKASVDGQNKEPLDRREIFSDAFVFFLAGHETTASALTWALGNLALHPEMQDRILAEVNEVCGDQRSPALDDVPLLVYTDAVIKETLRLFPPAVIVPKVATEHFMAGDDVIVREGTKVLFSIYGLHRSARYWDDPEEFRPERFLGDYNKDAFLPFSGGKRACVGRRFAEVEATIALATIVKQYALSLPAGVTADHLLDHTSLISLKPLHTMRLNFEPRVA